jgi:hypothetical protein
MRTPIARAQVVHVGQRDALNAARASAFAGDEDIDTFMHGFFHDPEAPNPQNAIGPYAQATHATMAILMLDGFAASALQTQQGR